MTTITAYVLEDGTYADPGEVTVGDDGLLRHTSGVAVAVAPHGPRTRSVTHQALAAASAKRTELEADGASQRNTRDMRPERTSRGYRTKA